ncbi:hypothetical protein [Streptomyces lonarensis]|uniref:Uncharacterized protein n=1 Tax=Streptomyces lonarensis TaxID=700599 RepID=A0A7X6CXC8_9ACTN|nr:hypothetical protein [Streptomyces lonarensis]NJQ04287.1 hypothetical protein [Streptomyces lonarensis]
MAPASTGPVRLYEYTEGGRTHRAKLNAADAARLGATPVGEGDVKATGALDKAARRPANKGGK